MIGIYQIKNLINGKSYVDKSIDIKRRWRGHRTSANTFYQDSKNELYKDMRKYGLENFEFNVLEICDKESLNEKEEFWIEELDCLNNGYNCTRGGNHDFVESVKISQEQLLEIVDLLRRNEETITNIAKLFSVGIDTVSEINNGKTRVIDGMVYPIRKTRCDDKFCPFCGKKILSYSTMCPDCWSIKNRKVDRPSKEKLRKLISENSFCKIGRMFGVTDNTIRKWAKRYGLLGDKK